MWKKTKLYPNFALMSKLIIYHNPRCGKSRKALEALENSHIEFEVVEYLKDFPSKKDLKKLLQKLNVKPFDVIRTKEPVFIEKFKDKKFTNEEWINIIIENPILLERPIIAKEYKASICRTDEAIEEILK